VSLLPPIFQQNREYSARVARQFLDFLGDEGVVGSAAFLVSQRDAGAAMAVDVAAGKAFVAGDDQANQGTYLCVSEAVTELPIAAADLSDDRIDRVILRVRDPNSGGPAGDDAVLQVLTGTPAAAPVPPALPDTAISLATVLVAASATSIVDADITDVRPSSSTPLRAVLADLNDVVITSPEEGEVLTYDGSEWVNEKPPAPFRALFFLMGA